MRYINLLFTYFTYLLASVLNIIITTTTTINKIYWFDLHYHELEDAAEMLRGVASTIVAGRVSFEGLAY